MTHARRGGRGRNRAFTLIELMVAIAVLALILVLMASATDQVRKLFSRSVGQAKSFEAARTAYDLVTRALAGATLNTYLDYDNPAQPSSYVRISEMHFLSGPTSELLSGIVLPGAEIPTWGDAVFFAQPLGFSPDPTTSRLKDLLNAGGFFVEYGDGRNERPSALGDRVPVSLRYRLVEVLEPTAELSMYNHDPRGTNPAKPDPPRAWIAGAVAGQGGQNVRLVADNIIGFFVWPQTADGNFLTNTNRVYDTRVAGALTSPQPPSAHQLPPIVRVVMVAIDEGSASRLDASPGDVSDKIGPAFAGLFDSVTTNEEVDAALRDLELRLAAIPVEFRMFNSYVQLGEAKWNE